MHRARCPQIAALIKAIYPGVDLTQPSAVLQLTFFGFGSFIIGLARRLVPGRLGERRRPATARGRPVDAAVAGRAGRCAAGSACMGAIGVVTVVDRGAHRRSPVVSQGGDVVGAGRRASASSAWRRPPSPVSGWRSVASSGRRWRRGVTGVPDHRDVRSSTRSGAALKLPDAILELSLYKHLGQPMAGIFDPVGLVVAAVMAVGGLAVCTWGLTRRDIGR